ncbi:accessory gland protein Acp29AB-like [Drosophila obscura]|uniref:accessory gland protein Acp29AB-like n=1 Tax=Drosophila obscura TaxID=7282 RepID=UPI001BB20EB0|nr:accessory gland protein Acp29AB-like [Drosophila obscura]
MRCSIVFILLAITFGRSLSQHCEVDESQHECGGYCYGAVKPVLDYLAILQKRVESCEAKQPADTLSKIALMNEKLDTLAGHMATQQYLEKRSTAKTHELEQQLASERKERDEKLDTLQAMEKSLQEKVKKLELKLKPKNLELFKKIGSKYYYIENTKKTNWQGALDICQEMGAHLVSLQNEDELKAIDSIVYSLYWIDLKKLEAEGEFISATTGVKGTFFHWAGKEPYGENCDCVYLLRGEMRTNLCGLTLLYFICEAYWVD